MAQPDSAAQPTIPTLEGTPERARQWLLAGFVLILSLALAITLNAVPPIRYKSDIYLRWYATTRLFEEGRNLYDGRNASEVIGFVYGPDYTKQTNFFYPAHLLLITGPLALLPFGPAHLLWTFVGQLGYIAAVWLSARLAAWPVSTNRLTLFLLSAIVFVPFLQHTIWSQFNTIGLLALVLAWQALRQHRFMLAGALAVGLTLKPQASLLTLAFLLGWAVWTRPRWRFLAGFAATAAFLWLAAELLQPDWVPGFLSSLGGYKPIQSVVDRLWNPSQLAAGLLVAGTLLVFIRDRHAAPDDTRFAGCLCLSVAIWFLVAPIEGMFHALTLPVTAAILLGGLRQNAPQLYRPALYSLLAVYLAGWLGFLLGLSSPALYGRHIAWSELAYRSVAPVLLAIFSLPLCLRPAARSA